MRGIDALNAAVERGDLSADWPNWIDPRHLIMSSSERCVLGQVFESVVPTEDQANAYMEQVDLASLSDGYERGLAVLDGDVAVNPDDYGFETADGSYGALDKAWRIALGDTDE